MNRPIAFVLASTDHGTMIVNRNDYQMADQTHGYGVGFEILNLSAFDRPGVSVGTKLLQLRRKHFGDGVVAIDCGANIGVMTVEWAREMTGWGEVFAIEAQERVCYALAGNIAINNCFNAHAIYGAVGASCDRMTIPQLDPTCPASFGSLELKELESPEWIGQPRDGLPPVTISCIMLDYLKFSRVDLIKIDVEGMETEVLIGAADIIAKHRPMMIVEYIKGEAAVRSALTTLGYKVMVAGGGNFVAVHESDPGLAAIKEGTSNEREMA